MEDMKIMYQKTKEEIFSQLVDSINGWLTDCLFLCGGSLRGKYQLTGIKDQIWNLVDSYAEIARSKYGKERDEESEKTALKIIDLLNAAIEGLMKGNTTNNFFVIDLSLHKKEIVEKLSYIR